AGAGRNPVAVLGPDGVELPASGGPDGQAIFDVPARIAAGPDGSLYLAVFEEHAIYKVGPQGEPLGSWSGFGEEPGRFRWPEGLAVSESGAVFVADTGNNRIQKFDASGNLLLAWGQSGSEPGQFNRPERKSTRLNSSHVKMSYAVFCLKKKKSCAPGTGHCAGANCN